MNPVFPLALAGVLLLGGAVIWYALKLSRPPAAHVVSGRERRAFRAHQRAFERDLREQELLVEEAARTRGVTVGGVPPPTLVEQFESLYQDAMRELSQVDGPQRADDEAMLAAMRSRAAGVGLVAHA